MINLTYVAILSLFTSIAAAVPAPAPITANVFVRDTCNATALDPKVQSYTVASGDTLTSIAKKFNRGICDIAKANSITNINVINLGAILTIPAQVCNPDSTSCLTPAPTVTATCILGGPGFYSVVSGDTLTAIAGNYKITLAALEAANPQITNPDLIYVGQVINIPVCPGSSCSISPYTIKSGDIFFDLATKAGSTTGQLLALNTGTDPSKLKIGQVVTVASDCKAENKYWEGKW